MSGAQEIIFNKCVVGCCLLRVIKLGLLVSVEPVRKVSLTIASICCFCVVWVTASQQNAKCIRKGIKMTENIILQLCRNLDVFTLVYGFLTWVANWPLYTSSPWPLLDFCWWELHTVLLLSIFLKSFLYKYLMNAAAYLSDWVVNVDYFFVPT